MRAKLNYIRIAPRKLRLVADTIRRKKVSEAKTILKFSKKKGAKFLAKVLDSAVSNTGQTSTAANLRISRLIIDQGPVFKRHMARARGVPALIRKKTSKIVIELS